MTTRFSRGRSPWRATTVEAKAKYLCAEVQLGGRRVDWLLHTLLEGITEECI